MANEGSHDWLVGAGTLVLTYIVMHGRLVCASERERVSHSNKIQWREDGIGLIPMTFGLTWEGRLRERLTECRWNRKAITVGTYQEGGKVVGV